MTQLSNKIQMCFGFLAVILLVCCAPKSTDNAPSSEVKEVKEVVNSSANDVNGSEKMVFNAEGELVRPHPDTYTKWMFVGANVAPAELNKDNPTLFPGFHNTYMPHSDFEHYKETGEFRDGTQFLQINVHAVNKGQSGNGYFADGKIHSIKASVKSKARYPELPGNWGFYKWKEKHLDEPNASAPVSTAESCNNCHVTFAGSSDFVFVKNYPILRLYHPNSTIDKDKI